MGSPTAVNVVSFLKMTAGLPSIPLFVGYVLMIIVSGLWQRWTSPWDLKILLIIHNFGCCLASLVALIGFTYALVNYGSIYGKEVDLLLTQVFKLYWIIKVIELLDTVFMVLRHRQRQISFLHVYHHASMLLLSDMARLFYPWPSIATFLAINSFVHIILYLYYGLTALNPDNPPKWKQNMTKIQIIQFIAGFLIAGHGYKHHHFCIYSMIYGVTMIVLFSNFYFQAYIRQQPIRKDKKES